MSRSGGEFLRFSKSLFPSNDLKASSQENQAISGSVFLNAPPGSRIDLSGERPALLTPDGRIRLLYAPPHPTPSQRLLAGPVSGSLALLGPDGSTIAILPENRVDLRGGAFGLFLTADFPDGISDRDPVPASILMPTHNRFLLKVESP